MTIDIETGQGAIDNAVRALINVRWFLADGEEFDERGSLAEDLRDLVPNLEAFVGSHPDGGDRAVLEAQSATIDLAREAFLALRRAELRPGDGAAAAEAVAAGDEMLDAFLAADTVTVDSVDLGFQYIALASGVAAIRGRVALKAEGGAIARDGLSAAFSEIEEKIRDVDGIIRSLIADTLVIAEIVEVENKLRSSQDGLPRVEDWNLSITGSFDSPYFSNGFGWGFFDNTRYQIAFDAAGNAESGLDAARNQLEADRPALIEERRLSGADEVADEFLLGFVRDGLKRWNIGEQVDAPEGGGTARGSPDVDFILGSAGDDVLSGEAGADALRGGAGDDDLKGGSGNDTLDGGTGADTLQGGQGNDLFLVDDPEDVVIERNTDFHLFDEVRATADYAIGDALIERVRGIGEAGLALTGSVRREEVIGGAGDDTIDGGGGRDTLTGGEGADTFLFLAPPRRTVIQDFTSGEDVLTFAADLLGLVRDGNGPVALTREVARELFDRGVADYDARRGDIFIDYADDDQGLIRAVSVGRGADLTFSDVWLF